MAEQERTGLDHHHEHIAVRTYCADCGQELASQVFNRADIESQNLTELPGREAMSLVNANLAIPINVALAANILSDGAIAVAEAIQQTPIDQSQGGGAVLEPPADQSQG